MSNSYEAPACRSARDWSPILNRYRCPDTARSLMEIAVTAVPFVLLWILMWICLQWSYLLTLVLAVPTAGFLVRLFMIQHDCGHGAFFQRRRANDWTGRAISVLTLTPYDYWRRSHATHHATSGNLDHRGIGDILTLTVDEYLARPWYGRLAYRAYRHPLVMFALGPSYLFLVQNRFPNRVDLLSWRAWLSPMATSGAIALLAAAVMAVVGVVPFLLVHIPVVVIAASVGVWLFYVQHQFEDTFWAKRQSWSHHDAALFGSSYYDLPPVLRWFTANIGVHHIHHMSCRIPYYRLSSVLRDYPELKTIGRMNIRDSLACIPLVLWDETGGRLIPFRRLRARKATGLAAISANVAASREDQGALESLARR